MPNPTHANSSETKKAYTTPKLTTHGDVATLTKGVPPGPVIGSGIIIIRV